MKISIVLAALTGSFETDMNRASKTAQKRMREIEKTAKEVGKVVGAALAAAATASAVAIKAAIDRADELSKAAQKIGITTEALSALSYAAELADVDLATLTTGLAKLTKFQSDAAQGAEKNVSLFRELGIEFQNIDGTLRNSEEVFREFSDVFATLPDGATKTALALDVFGRSGANLIPLLNEGSAGLDEMRERAEDLGIVISTETGRAAEEFNDRLSDLKLAATGLATAVAAELLPDLNRLTGELQEGVEQGEGFAATAENIANGIRGVAFVAAKAYDTIDLLAMGIANITAKTASFLATYTLAGRLSTTAGQRQALDDVASVTGDRAGDAARRLVGGEQEREIVWIDPPEAKASAAAVEEVNSSLERYYGRATAAKAASDALAASRDAQREAEKAAREMEKRESDAMEELAKRKAEQYDELNEIRKREREEMAKAKELVDQTLADIAFETQLIGLNNLEREKAIALRYAQVDAASAEGQAISAAIEQMDEAARNAEGVEFLKDEMKGFLVDLTDGVGSLEDAWDSFFDNLTARVMQMVADQLIEQLFAGMSNTGGGAGGGGGGWLAAIGSLFGGARAGGGDVMSGKAYLVGEEGPELVIPSAAGTVVPAGRTAAMMRGGGDTHFHIQGSTSKRSTDRIAIEQSRRQRRATAEFA